jgi:hypothetical protein
MNHIAVTIVTSIYNNTIDVVLLRSNYSLLGCIDRYGLRCCVTLCLSLFVCLCVWVCVCMCVCRLMFHCCFLYHRHCFHCTHAHLRMGGASVEAGGHISRPLLEGGGQRTGISDHV